MSYMEVREIPAEGFDIRAGCVENSLKTRVKKMMKEIRADNKIDHLETKLQRVKNTKTLKENIEKVLEFDAECEQNGRRIASRYSALITLHCLSKFAGKKDFKAFTKTDIISFLDAVKNRKLCNSKYKAKHKNDSKQLANSTMNLTKFRTKRFFQWLFDCEKGQYPENVRWIELKVIKGDHELTPEELPTVQEVKQMIECTENPRDRALLFLMAESGARAGEISTLRIKDIIWNEDGFGFLLNIRTGNTKSKFGRRIPLCACAEDIKRWINDYHPFNNNPCAPLFTSYVDERVKKTNLKVAAIGVIVKKVACRAGIDKRIHMHSHKFRHFRASQLAELGWNEMMLRQYFGWSKTSNMPAIYIHMSQKSMNNRYYQMYGKAKPAESKEHNLEGPKNCRKCGLRNPTGYRFCFQCNTLLEEDKQKLIKDQNDSDNMLNLIAKNPELAEKLTQLLQEAMLKERLQEPASIPLPTQL